MTGVQTCALPIPQFLLQSHHSIEEHLKANVDLQARTYNLGMVTAMLDPSLTQEIRIPSGISINGNVKVDGTKYATRLALTEGKGSMKVDATVDARTSKDGSLDMNNLAYQAKLQASNIQAKHFLPHQDLYTFTGAVSDTNLYTSRDRWCEPTHHPNKHSPEVYLQACVG